MIVKSNDWYDNLPEFEYFGYHMIYLGNQPNGGIWFEILQLFKDCNMQSKVLLNYSNLYYWAVLLNNDIFKFNLIGELVSKMNEIKREIRMKKLTRIIDGK